MVSQNVYGLLKTTESAIMWSPDELENIFDTMSVDFMVSADDAKFIEPALREHASTTTTILIQNAGELINDQRLEKRARLPEVGKFALDEYLEYPDLEEWLAATAEQYSDHSELIQLATTHEGRKLWGLHIGDKIHDGPKKKIFMGNLIDQFWLY